MKITGLKNFQPTFKAHTYKVRHKNPSIFIQTDNEKKLGDEPYLVYHGSSGEEQVKMKKDNGLYSARILPLNASQSVLKYHILYKDTGKIDLNNGEEYQINPKKLRQKAAYQTRIMHRQPVIFTIKEGKTTGKVVYNDKGYYAADNKQQLSDINEPTILVTPHFSKDAGNPNIKGIIYTSCDQGAFSHQSTRLRQQTDVCGAIYEPDILEKLISMDGKNVELEIKKGIMSFKETNEKGKPMVYPQIDVPKLKTCNKILTSKEYTPDVIGAKAVNLRRMEELKEQGKINVIIPKSIALPCGYVQEIFDENPLQEEIYNKKKDFYTCKERARIPYREEYCKKRTDAIKQQLYKNGIIETEKDWVMVRSAFNGEDLPNYSAAGIYQSSPSRLNNEELYNQIIGVAQSKWNPDARFSRKMHGIPEENIQYGIIIQQMIKPDYKFTIYTDDEKGNLKIDLYSGRYLYENSINPHTFTYNKKTNELTYNSIQLFDPEAEFDENQEFKRAEPVEYDLSGNKELFEQLKKAAQDAITVEKEFEYPQDIEGGIKGGNIYFWQTRNIVR